MNPTPGDVHVNAPLTNMSLAYVQGNDAFVADRVFPNIPVAKQSDLYWTYDRGHFWRDSMQLRAPATESKGFEYTVDSTPNYFCRVNALHHDIPDEVRANADSPLNPDRETTLLVTQLAMVKREKDWVAKYLTGLTGTWTNAITGAASTQWDNGASDPIAAVRLGKRTIAQLAGIDPNTFVMGRAVYDALLDHPDIVDRIKYGQTPGSPALTNSQILAQIFGLDRVLVSNAVENVSAEGITNSFSFIAGKHALLLYAAPNPGLMTPSAGYTFSWTGFYGATSMGWRIKRFRMEHLNSDRIEIDMAYDQKLVSADLGYQFISIVA
jgi:Phage major capsid protein E